MDGWVACKLEKNSLTMGPMTGIEHKISFRFQKILFQKILSARLLPLSYREVAENYHPAAYLTHNFYVTNGHPQI